MRSRLLAIQKGFSSILHSRKFATKPHVDLIDFVLFLQLLLLLQRFNCFIFYGSQYSLNKTRCPPHMNELPVPCGPWDPWYRQKQSFYMKHLLFGLAWWLFSFSMAIYTDSLYLNWGPPDFPSPPSDMVEECEDP